MGPEDPTVATEWIVESRGGGTCVVRVVHSWFTDKDSWDEQYEGHSHGWVAFFRILRLYLAHFSGQRGEIVQAMGAAPEPKEAAWEVLTKGLGVTGAAVGQRVETAAGAPMMKGVVERAGEEAWPEELLVRLDAPAPGLAHLVPHAMMGQVFVTVRLFFYGEGAAETAKEQGAIWQEWLNATFAPVEVPS
jgi:hypothetical protein